MEALGTGTFQLLPCPELHWEPRTVISCSPPLRCGRATNAHKGKKGQLAGQLAKVWNESRVNCPTIEQDANYPADRRVNYPDSLSGTGTVQPHLNWNLGRISLLALIPSLTRRRSTIPR